MNSSPEVPLEDAWLHVYAFCFEYRLSARKFLCLLQTRNGLLLFGMLRSVVSEVDVPKTTHVLRSVILLAAGARLKCPTCKSTHDQGSPLPWRCRRVGKNQEEMGLFDRARQARQCYVLLCGIKKFRNPPLLVPIDRFVVRQIAHSAWCHQFFDERPIVASHAWRRMLYAITFICMSYALFMIADPTLGVGVYGAVGLAFLSALVVPND